MIIEIVNMDEKSKIIIWVRVWVLGIIMKFKECIKCLCIS